MKKIKIYSGLLFLTAVFLVLSNSCCKDDPTDPPQLTSTTEKTTTDEFDQLLPVTDFLQITVLEKATISSEFAIKESTMPGDEYSDVELNEESNTFYCTGKKENTFVKFLNSLNLTREQKIKLHSAIYDFQLCKKEINMMVKRVHNDILTKFNAQRTELIRQYKAGEITEQELKASLEKLHQRAENALKDALTKLNVKEKLSRCNHAFMEKVKMILTAEQWEKWVKWHKNGDKGTGGNTGTGDKKKQ